MSLHYTPPQSLFSQASSGKLDYLLKTPTDFVAFGVPLNVLEWDKRQELIEGLIHGAENAISFSPEVKDELSNLSAKAATDVADGKRFSPAASAAWIEASQILGERAVHAEMMIQLLNLDSPALIAAFGNERKRIAELANGKRIRLTPQGKHFATAVDLIVSNRVGSERFKELKKDSGKLKVARENAVQHLEFRLREKAQQFGKSVAVRKILLEEYANARDVSMRLLRQLVPAGIPKKWNFYAQAQSGIEEVKNIRLQANSTGGTWNAVKKRLRNLTDGEPMFEYRCVKDEQGGLVLTKDDRPIFFKVLAPTWGDLLPIIGESALKYEFAPAMMLDALGQICHAIAIKTGRVAATKDALTARDMAKASIAGDFLERPPYRSKRDWDQGRGITRN